MVGFNLVLLLKSAKLNSMPNFTAIQYVALCRSMKPLQLILIQEENSRVQRQGHMNKNIVNILILVVYTWDYR